MKRQSFSPFPVVIPLMIAGIVWFLTDGSPGPAGKQKNAGIPAGAPIALDVRQLGSKESRSLAVEDASGHGPAGATTGGSRGVPSGFNATFQPAREGAGSVAIPTDSPRSAPLETTVLTSDFLESIVDAARKRVRFTLPDGTIAGGTVELLRTGDQGILSVQGFMERHSHRSGLKAIPQAEGNPLVVHSGARLLGVES